MPMRCSMNEVLRMGERIAGMDEATWGPIRTARALPIMMPISLVVGDMVRWC